MSHLLLTAEIILWQIERFKDVRSTGTVPFGETVTPLYLRIRLPKRLFPPFLQRPFSVWLNVP